ncbi:MAG: metallophosphoesterase [Pseudomonadota bacterium]
MFGIIILSAVTVMQVYVFWRAGTVPFVKNHIPGKFLFLAGLLLWACFFFTRIFDNNRTGHFSAILEFISMTWMAILFLTFIPVLVIDLITGFSCFFPRYARSARGLALIAGLFLSAIALIQGLRPPVVNNHEIFLSGLRDELDGITIVAISDLHLGSLIGTEWLEARIAQVSEQKPDIIILLGDISEGHGESTEDLLPILNRFSAPLGVWAVLGNHEFHSHRNMEKSLIEKTSFNLLRNSWQEIQPGLVLAGVDDLTFSRLSGRNDDLIAASLKNRPQGPTILLSHNPLQLEKAASAGVDLMLSGHTHGGQIWPFNYIVGSRYPFLEGLHKINNMNLIISRGAGTWGPRMRLWCPGEILRITLHPNTIS